MPESFHTFLSGPVQADRYANQGANLESGPSL